MRVSLAMSLLILRIITSLNSVAVPEDELYDIYLRAWASSSDEIRQELPIEYQAAACGMDVNTFEFMARVIQAESDGTDDMNHIDGKILIACVILNRVESSQFNSTIPSVLTQDGQFTTVSNGWCSASLTRSSRWAIVEAQRALYNDEVPRDLLYFNCVGYNYGTPYGYVDGNYFMRG